MIRAVLREDHNFAVLRHLPPFPRRPWGARLRKYARRSRRVTSQSRPTFIAFRRPLPNLDAQGGGAEAGLFRGLTKRKGVMRESDHWAEAYGRVNRYHLGRGLRVGVGAHAGGQ